MTTALNSGELLGSSVLLHSGNIASWNKLRKKGVVTSTDELVSATEAAFKSWLGRPSEESFGDVVVVRNAGLSQEVKGGERENYVFTLKVFVSRWEPDLVQEAVMKTLSEIGISSVDTLVLSFPACPEDELLENLKPMWAKVEELARSGVASVVGTADVFMPQLKELYDWAAIKPSVNQVNLSHCCTMPEDMIEFSKQNKVTLNTHNDEQNILPLTQLHTALSSSLGGDHTHWSHTWVARYSSIIKLRGIISHKGYVVGLTRTSS